MSDLSVDKRLARAENAASIIADYERQHDFQLPMPWKEAIPQLLRRGLADPSLHLIFNTLMRVEYDAGRLAEQPADYTLED